MEWATYLAAFLILVAVIVSGYLLISMAGAVSEQMYAVNQSLTVLPGNPTVFGINMGSVVYSTGSTIYWALTIILTATVIAIIISLAFSRRR